MPMPNFLIIGVAKSGTTSLYRCLEQHPQVFMSHSKEPSFFAFEGEGLNSRRPGDRWVARYAITDIESYQALFQGVLGETAIGEGSNAYLYSARAPQRIRHYVPEMKLIAILRHPVERAYSAYLMCVHQGREPCQNFAEAVRAEEARIRDSWSPMWHYVRGGLYSKHLKHYFDLFDLQQIRVYLLDDFKVDPVSVLRDAFRFLCVDETFVPDVPVKYTVGGVPKNKLVHALLSPLLLLVARPNPVKAALKQLLPAGAGPHAGMLKRLRNLEWRNMVKPPPLSPELRRELLEVYREDILRLQDMIGRDLSAWLEP